MKHWKLPILTLGLLLCLGLIPARAAPLLPDMPTTLSIQYRYQGTAIDGARFTVYRVAERQSEFAFSPLPPFTLPSFEDGIEGIHTTDQWNTLANTVKGWISSDPNFASLTPTAEGVTRDGAVTFDTGANLLPGLYLVIPGDRTIGRDSYRASPFFLALPMRNSESGDWDYDCVDAVRQPKLQCIHTPDSGGGSKPKTVSRKVLKIWEDEGFEAQRPASVRVNLLRDGAVYDTVTLSGENNWRYTWDNLSARYDWTVSEPPMEGYLPLTQQTGITDTITNRPTTDLEEDDPPLSDTPQTPEGTEPPDNTVTIDLPDDPPPLDGGNQTPPSVNSNNSTTHERLPQTGLLWWPVSVLAGAGLVCVLIGLLRKGNDHQNNPH